MSHRRLISARVGWFLSCLNAAAAAAAICGSPVYSAESDREEAGQEPVAILAIAGVDRVLEDVDHVLASIDQLPLAGAVRGFVSNLNDLKGIDRARPIGVLLFASADLKDDPRPVVFYPVSDIVELQKTMQFSNQFSLEATEAPDRYSIQTPNGSLPVRLIGGYAYAAKDEDLLDRDLPSEADFAAMLAPGYDVAISLRRAGVPEAVFDKALADLRRQAEQDLEQKESEGDAEYQIRRAVTESLLSLAEQVIADGRALSLGWSLTPDGPAQLDVTFQVEPDSELAFGLAEATSSGSRFSAQLAEPTPLSWGTSWKLAREDAAILHQVLDLVQREAGKNAKVDLAADSDHPLRRLVDSLRATVDAGRIDSFMQFVGEPPERFVLVGGLQVADGANLAKAIEAILPHAAQSDDVEEVTMHAAECGGVNFHRIRGKKVRMQEALLYGDDAALYLGVGEDVLWIAVGGARTPDVLREIVPLETPPEADGDVPLMRATLHLTSWMGVIGADGSEKSQQFVDAAREAFRNPDEDAIRFELAPTGDGLRLRLLIDSGYLRLLGIAAAKSAGR